MKRRIIYLLTGLALIASFAVASPGDASADERSDRCGELLTGMIYNIEEGNIEYAAFLGNLAALRSCDF
jgi:hypothetical protein